MANTDLDAVVADARSSIHSAINAAASRLCSSILINLLGALLVLHLVFLFARVEGDAGVFMTIGAGLLEGKLPYVDYVDHKPPGIYFLLATAFAFIRSVFSAKLLILGTNLATAAGVYRLSAQLINHRDGLIAAILFLAGSLVYSGPYVYTEQFVALFGLLALVVFLIAERSGHLRYHLIAGLLVGVSILFKQPGGAFLFGFFAYFAFTFHEREVPRLLLDITAIILAAALPYVLVGAYFYTVDAFSQYLTWTFLVHITDGGYAANPFVVIAGNLREISKFPFLWVFAVTGLGTIAHRETSRDLRIVAIVAVSSMTPLLLRGWGHYYLQPLPFLAVIAAYGLRRSLESIRPITSEFEPRIAILALVLVLSVPSIQVVGMATYSDVVTDNVWDDQRLGAHIASQTQPDEPILTIGEQAKFYFFADREPMNHHLYYLNINRHLYSEPELIRTIAQKKVAYVIIRKPCGNYLPEVCDYIEVNYKLERVDGSLYIYRRTP